VHLNMKVPIFDPISRDAAPELIQISCMRGERFRDRMRVTTLRW
jgi:hypothetical protein